MWAKELYEKKNRDNFVSKFENTFIKCIDKYGEKYIWKYQKNQSINWERWNQCCWCSWVGCRKDSWCSHSRTVNNNDNNNNDNCTIINNYFPHLRYQFKQIEKFLCRRKTLYKCPFGAVSCNPSLAKSERLLLHLDITLSRIWSIVYKYFFINKI